MRSGGPRTLGSRKPRHPSPWRQGDLPGTGRVPVSVVILAKNEALTIARAISSCGWAEQVVVVDSGSSDGTVRIAEESGCDIVETDWPGFGLQRQRVLTMGIVRHEWILWVDADEYISPQLAVEVSEALRSPEVCAFSVRFKLRFQGAWIDHCGWASSWKTILVRRDSCSYADSWIDHPVVTGGVGRLRHRLVDADQKGLQSWLDKHIGYAELQVAEEETFKNSASVFGRLKEFRESRTTDVRPLPRALAKDLIFPFVPFKPLALFVYMYVLRLGFLDGKWGLRFCVYHAVNQMTVRALAEQQSRTSKGG